MRGGPGEEEEEAEGGGGQGLSPYPKIARNLVLSWFG